MMYTCRIVLAFYVLLRHVLHNMVAVVDLTPSVGRKSDNVVSAAPCPRVSFVITLLLIFHLMQKQTLSVAYFTTAAQLLFSRWRSTRISKFKHYLKEDLKE